MHLLLSLVLVFQVRARSAVVPPCRPVVGNRDRPQPAVEDLDGVDAGSLAASFCG